MGFVKLQSETATLTKLRLQGSTHSFHGRQLRVVAVVPFRLGDDLAQTVRAMQLVPRPEPAPQGLSEAKLLSLDRLHKRMKDKEGGCAEPKRLGSAGRHWEAGALQWLAPHAFCARTARRQSRTRQAHAAEAAANGRGGRH